MKFFNLFLVFTAFVCIQCTEKNKIVPKIVAQDTLAIVPITTIPGTVVGISKPFTIKALGDSYTIGQSVTTNLRFPNQVVEKLIALEYDFAEPNVLATTGWTTRNLINAIESYTDTNKYDFVFLLIGVNNFYQGKSITTYRTEFAELLQTAIHFANDSAHHVVVLSIPDYAYTPFGQRSNAAYISKGIDDFNAINKEETQKINGVNYIDITPISRKGIEFPSYVASDGLHPSGVQYGLWADEIVKVLTPYIKKKN